VIPPKFRSASDFGDGVAYAEIESKGKFMIDKQGGIIREIDSIFGKFSDGLAQVHSGDAMNGKWGYINVQGEIAIEPIYENAMPFSQGLAAVLQSTKDGYKWGFIDTNGKMVINPIYDKVSNFDNGYSTVYIYNKRLYYIINKTGKALYSSGYPVEPTK
jgi:hypothetical protein